MRFRSFQLQHPQFPFINLLNSRGLILAAVLALPTAAQAAVLQGLGASPWEQTINSLEIAFTGPIARGLSLVAVVIGGLMYAFGEGQSKRTMAGLIFGVGMALAAFGSLFTIERVRTARVAELADALDLGSSARKGVGVRIPSLAPASPAWIRASRRREAPFQPGAG